MRLLAIASLLIPVLAAPQASGGQPTFTDVTLAAGVDYVQLTNVPQFSEVLRMTGGAAAGDVNGDGYPDLFVTRLDQPDILLLNNRQGGFDNVSAAAGFTANLRTNGAAMGDVDNDGDLDLYLTGAGTDRHFLYINDGSGRFSEQAVARQAAILTGQNRYGTSAALGDYDNDGYLDLHVNEWGNYNYRPPELWSHVRVLHNLGAANPGHFEDTTLATGVYLDDYPGWGANDDRTGVFTFSSSFADFDRDGHADVAIAADFHTSQLFWNNGDGTFTKAPGPYSAHPTGVGTDENGMGSAIGDINGDGLLDWFVTSIYDTDMPCPQALCSWNHSGNRLYLNNGDRTFTDATDQYGVRDGGWGWGAAMLDYDNDGDLDLTMTNGMIGRHNALEKFATDPLKLWRNDGDHFTEVAVEEGLTDTGSGKGLLTFDYDLDGDLDLFVVNNNGHPKLYRNETNDQGNFLSVRTRGTLSNRDGMGAYLTLTPDEGAAPLTRYVTGGSNYLSQSDMTVHFGLGDRSAPLHELVVEWPSGIRQVLYDVPVNSRLVVWEGVPEPGTLLLSLGALVAACGRPAKRERISRNHARVVRF
jgi:hypothetical protein